MERLKYTGNTLGGTNNHVVQPELACASIGANGEESLISI